MNYTKHEVDEKTFQILVEYVVDENDIDTDTNLQDNLDLDSQQRVDFFTAVENVFAVDIPDDSMKELITFGDVIDYLWKKLRKVGRLME